jgi:hypothetical protein
MTPKPLMFTPMAGFLSIAQRFGIAPERIKPALVKAGVPEGPIDLVAEVSNAIAGELNPKPKRRKRRVKAR